MSASSNQLNIANVALLGGATTRFIRLGRGSGWAGLRVLPIVAASVDVKDEDQVAVDAD
jgi:hypothetical protein